MELKQAVMSLLITACLCVAPHINGLELQLLAIEANACEGLNSLRESSPSS